MFTLAELNSASLDAIKNLESEIGTPLVAVSEVSVTAADINDATLTKIKALEQKLDAVLVAVDK